MRFIFINISYVVSKKVNECLTPKILLIYVYKSLTANLSYIFIDVFKTN